MTKWVREVLYLFSMLACAAGLLLGIPAEDAAALPLDAALPSAGVSPGWLLENQIGVPASFAATIPLSLTRLNDLEHRIGDPLPPDQQLRLTSGDYSVKYSAHTTDNWLSVTPREGATPQTLTVGFNPSYLSPGRYYGGVVVDAPESTDRRVSTMATLAVRTSFTVNPASLAFRYRIGGGSPVPQTLSVQSRAATTFEISKAAGGAWLNVSPAQGATPASVTVSAVPGALAAGSYDTSLYVVVANSVEGTRSIPVQLVISSAPPPHFIVGKTDLLFDALAGGEPPPAQSIAVASSGEPIGFVASAVTDSGGDWLAVSPASGITPASLAVTVNLTRLAVGKYAGTITLSSADTSISPQRIRVTLAVAAPQPRVTAVVNAASFLAGPIAPGELIVLFGSSVGPPALTTLRVGPDGRVGSTLENTRVWFDGVAAPLIYVSAVQTAAVVPYVAYGRASVTVTVEHQGWVSNPVELRVADSAPGIFTMGSTGRGQGAILNEDYTPNTPSNPLPRSGVAMLYATGAGQTDPPGLDGSIAGAILPVPLAPVTLAIGGAPAQVIYAGAAPGAVAGVVQVNFVVPAEAPAGDAVPVVLTVAGNKSQSNVTMAVR